MGKAYIKVRHLSQVPSGNFLGVNFKMVLKLTPGSIPLSVNFSNTHPPYCNSICRFDFTNTEKEVFEITLQEANRFPQIDFAKVILPLQWFPKDQIVTWWFPLMPTRQERNSQPLFVLLDIHLAEKTNEFQAQPGRMLVEPKWEVPKQLLPYMTPPRPSAPQNYRNMYPPQYPNIPVPHYPNPSPYPSPYPNPYPNPQPYYPNPGYPMPPPPGQPFYPPPPNQVYYPPPPMMNGQPNRPSGPNGPWGYPNQ